MTTQTRPSTAQDAGAVTGELAFRDQLISAVLGSWMIVGLFLDGWAHDNQKPESFFTPWHGFLYSGFLASAAFAVQRALAPRRPGRSLRSTLPRGHGLTLVGLGAFAIGALGDLVWHELFGVEVGLEALLSPTHLLLMASGLVALSSPIRAAWHEHDMEPGLGAFTPVALSTALLAALVAFFLSFFSPLGNDAGSTAFSRSPGQEHAHPSTDVAELQQLLGVGSVLLMSVVLAATAAVLLKRWRTPPGAFVIVFGVVVLFLAGADDFEQPLIAITGSAAGVAADLLARRRMPPAVVTATAVAVLWLTYFGAHAIHAGAVAWSAELWTGTVFLGALLAGAVGLLATPMPGPEPHIKAESRSMPVPR